MPIKQDIPSFLLLSRSPVFTQRRRAETTTSSSFFLLTATHPSSKKQTTNALLLLGPSLPASLPPACDGSDPAASFQFLLSIAFYYESTLVYKTECRRIGRGARDERALQKTATMTKRKEEEEEVPGRKRSRPRASSKLEKVQLTLRRQGRQGARGCRSDELIDDVVGVLLEEVAKVVEELRVR